MLECAIQRGNFPTVQLLLKYGANHIAMVYMYNVLYFDFLINCRGKPIVLCREERVTSLQIVQLEFNISQET